MKRVTVFMTALLMTMGVSAQESEPKQIELTKEEVQLVQKNNDFAFRLFREARGNESQLLSPLSITYALGMLNNAATGKTQQEINDVLGFGNAGAEAINRFCQKMLLETAGLDEETKGKRKGQKMYLLKILNGTATIPVSAEVNYELIKDKK